MTTFNRKLDNVCEKLDKIGVDGLRGGRGKLATNRRARLVEYAVATRLVSADDLALLDRPTTAPAGERSAEQRRTMGRSSPFQAGPWRHAHVDGRPAAACRCGPIRRTRPTERSRESTSGHVHGLGPRAQDDRVRRRARASLAGVPLTFAVLHQGFPVTDPDLRARDVWVTNGEDLLAGRLNRQIEELDAAVAHRVERRRRVPGRRRRLPLRPRASARSSASTRRSPRSTERIDVPPGSTVAYGGDVLAMLVAEGRAVDASAAGDQLSFDAVGTDPIARSSATTRSVAVSADGHGRSRRSPTTTSSCTASDVGGGEPRRTPLPKLGAHQLAAVGERAVVLDTETRASCSSTAGRSSSPSRAFELQQSGAEHDVAYVAAGGGLLRVPLGGGDVARARQRVAAAAADRADDVAAPVWLERLRARRLGDVAAVPRRVRRREARRRRTIDQPTAGSRLEFRVNRDVIVLNNLTNGNVVARRLRPAPRRQLGGGHAARGDATSRRATRRRRSRPSRTRSPSAPTRTGRRSPATTSTACARVARRSSRCSRTTPTPTATCSRSPRPPTVAEAIGPARAHRRRSCAAVHARRGRRRHGRRSATRSTTGAAASPRHPSTCASCPTARTRRRSRCAIRRGERRAGPADLLQRARRLERPRRRRRLPRERLADQRRLGAVQSRRARHLRAQVGRARREGGAVHGLRRQHDGDRHAHRRGEADRHAEPGRHPRLRAGLRRRDRR